jgi:hypothetical protein
MAFALPPPGNECIAEYLKVLGIEDISDTGGFLWDGLGERMALGSCRRVLGYSTWRRRLAATNMEVGGFCRYPASVFHLAGIMGYVAMYG